MKTMERMSSTTAKMTWCEAWEIVARQSPSPKGYHWAVCASWPDAEIKVIYIARNAR